MQSLWPRTVGGLPRAYGLVSVLSRHPLNMAQCHPGHPSSESPKKCSKKCTRRRSVPMFLAVRHCARHATGSGSRVWLSASGGFRSRAATLCRCGRSLDNSSPLWRVDGTPPTSPRAPRNSSLTGGRLPCRRWSPPRRTSASMPSSSSRWSRRPRKAWAACLWTSFASTRSPSRRCIARVSQSSSPFRRRHDLSSGNRCGWTL